MSKIFEIIIAIIVALLLILFIFKLFIFPKTNIYADLEDLIILAKSKPGEPICKYLNLDKANVSSSLLFNDDKDLNYFIWFVGSEKLKVFANNDNFIININNNLGKKRICAVCYPKLMFNKDYDVFCELSFDSNYNSLNVNLQKINSPISQGFIYNNKINIPQNYKYYIYVFNNNKNIIANLESILDQDNEDIDLLLDKNFEFNDSGNKLVLQLVVKNNGNYYSGFGPAKFLYQNLVINVNSEYQKKDCVATYKEKQYYNYDLQKCVYYNYCNNCILPNHCAEKWNAESLSKDYSISYTNESVMECNE